MAYGGEVGPLPDRTDGEFRRGPGRAPALSAPARRKSSAVRTFPELDCLRDRLPAAVIAAVERRAIEAGVGAERVLIAEGIVAEETYLKLLARWLGLPFETFDGLGRRHCPLHDRRLVDAAQGGLLPLTIDGAPEFAVTPHSVRQFVAYVTMYSRPRFRLTSAPRLDRFVAHHGREALGRRAAFALDAKQPHLSAAGRSTALRVALAAIVAGVVAAFIGFPDATMATLAAGLSLSFLGWLGLRNFCSFLELPHPKRAENPDRDLPTYTIIAALYHETDAVEGLVAALQNLDYPHEKLDIKFVIERDDDDTHAALARLGLAAPFDVMIAPDIGPRTKPKALNAALLFARGAYTVIYDAEDRPERDQLRRAVDMFRAEDDDVACVQARLAIDNTDDSWLARLFTAEYAAQFDLFLPGLARLRAPLPLGGSSNHFRTDVLRAVGAWDPYNVTEDADLGVRLARYGYRSTVIESVTYEEAPARFGAWLHQRTRWFKGWMQTWAVHMRTPIRLLRELGPGGFVAFQLVVGGNVLAALIHPIFVALLAYALIARPSFAAMDGGRIALALLYGATLSAGYLTSILLGMRGLARHGLMHAAPSLALVPVHWLLLSLAAWRALLQLARDPHGWEKTEHGLARSSRRAKMVSAAALDAVFRREPVVGCPEPIPRSLTRRPRPLRNTDANLWRRPRLSA